MRWSWFNTNYHAVYLLDSDKPCSKTPKTRERKGMAWSTKKICSLSLSLSPPPFGTATSSPNSLPCFRQPTTCSFRSQMNPIHFTQSYFFKIHLHIIFPSTSKSSKLSHSINFLHKNAACISSFPTLPTFPVHLKIRRINGSPTNWTVAIFNPLMPSSWQCYRRLLLSSDTFVTFPNDSLAMHCLNITNYNV